MLIVDSIKLTTSPLSSKKTKRKKERRRRRRRKLLVPKLGWTLFFFFFRVPGIKKFFIYHLNLVHYRSCITKYIFGRIREEQTHIDFMGNSTILIIIIIICVEPLIVIRIFMIVISDAVLEPGKFFTRPSVVYQ